MSLVFSEEQMTISHMGISPALLALKKNLFLNIMENAKRTSQD